MTTIDKVLLRLKHGEKLLARSCAECNYPCGYVMRGGNLCFDGQCWCTPDIVAAFGGAVMPATREEIEHWIADDDDLRLRRLLLYCDDLPWTPYSWRKYIGAA